MRFDMFYIYFLCDISDIWFLGMDVYIKMDQIVEISLPRTQTRKKNGVFHSLYTVINR